MLLLHSETSPAVVDAQHATIRLRGCLHARCFATERESWSVVAQELRDDVASSLRTRVALLCDELGDEAEAGSSKKQLLEKGVAGVVVCQLPRRVVADGIFAATSLNSGRSRTWAMVLAAVRASMAEGTSPDSDDLVSACRSRRWWCGHVRALQSSCACSTSVTQVVVRTCKCELDLLHFVRHDFHNASPQPPDRTVRRAMTVKSMMMSALQAA